MKKSSKSQLLSSKHSSVVTPQTLFISSHNKINTPAKKQHPVSRSRERSPRNLSPIYSEKPFSSYDEPQTRAQIENYNKMKTKKEAQIEKNNKINLVIDEFFFKNSKKETLNTQIETLFEKNVPCSKVIFWEEIASLQLLYSNKLNKSVSHQGSIVGFAFSIRDVVQIPVAKKHQSYDPEIDGKIANPNDGVICFPLNDSNGDLIGIVEIFLTPGERNLSDFHLKMIDLFMRKFQAFSQWILEQPLPESIKDRFQALQEKDAYLEEVQKLLHMIFQAKKIEIWIYNKETDKLSMFIKKETKILNGNGGFVGNAVRNAQLAHTRNVLIETSYCKEIDGYQKEAVLVQPKESLPDSSIYAIVLRGSIKGEMFTHRDEILLKKVIVLVINSFKNCFKYEGTSNKQNNDDYSLIESLPEFKKPKLASQILPSLMESLKELLKCERVLYFSVDNNNKTVKSLYATGSDTMITYSFGEKHSGIVAETGQVINCCDATQDIDADTSFDIANKKQTKNILTVPVVTVDGKISAVIQAINRCDGEPFSKGDSKVSLVIGTICICLLENANLLVGSEAMKKNIKYSNELIDMLTQSVSFNDAGQKLCNLVKDVTNSKDSRILLLDKVSGKVYEYDNPEVEIQISEGPIIECFRKLTPVFCNNCSTNFPEISSYGINQICVAPLLISSCSAIGVLLCINSPLYTESECSLIKSFADIFTFVAQKFKENEKGNSSPFNHNIESTISFAERKTYEVPKQLSLPEDYMDIVTNIRFKFFKSDPSIITCLIFNLFDRLEIMKPLKITAEKLYEFTQVFNESFNDVPFHNENNAIDIAQFLVYMINAAKLKQVLSPVEIHALLAACFCSSMKHDGTNNAYNIASNSIQYKIYGEDVTTNRSLAILQQVYTEHGMLDGLSDADIDTFFLVSTTLLKANDPSSTPIIIEKVRNIIKTSLVDLSNTEHRLFVLEILFRCATLGWTCRPFGIASRWESMRANECFILGKLEKMKGLDYSSPDNNPETYCKSSAAINILTSQVIPLFDTLTVIFAELKVCCDAAKENLNAWTTENCSK